MDVGVRIVAWAKRLELTLDLLRRGGAEVEALFRAGAPGQHLLRDAEHDVGRPVPPILATIFSQLTALRGSWRLPDEFESKLPTHSQGVVWGGLDLSVSEMVSAETSRQGWVAECFSNPRDPYDAVWHDKFAFHSVANGDCLAVADGDDSGAVYYLSHDDGEGHGIQLAPSLVDFLDRWSRIGFAGPEDWLLLPFVRLDVGGIDDFGVHASAWRKALNLTALEGD